MTIAGLVGPVVGGRRVRHSKNKIVLCFGRTAGKSTNLVGSHMSALFSGKLGRELETLLDGLEGGIAMNSFMFSICESKKALCRCAHCNEPVHTMLVPRKTNIESYLARSDKSQTLMCLRLNQTLYSGLIFCRNSKCTTLFPKSLRMKFIKEI